MKITKMEKGITLIALIITILVLVILAAVSIGQITGGDGIIAEAESAAKKYADARDAEQANLVALESYLASKGNGGTTEKVDVALGSFVTYKGLKWRVVKNDSSSVELITADALGSVTIGSSADYNNAEATLLQECINVTNISTGIRCLDTYDLNTIWGIEDVLISSNSKSYWINYKMSIQDDEFYVDYYLQYVDGDTDDIALIYTNNNGNLLNHTPVTKAVRPIVTLSAGALDYVTGNGTSGQPYVLN